MSDILDQVKAAAELQRKLERVKFLLFRTPEHDNVPTPDEPEFSEFVAADCKQFQEDRLAAEKLLDESIAASRSLDLTAVAEELERLRKENRHLFLFGEEEETVSLDGPLERAKEEIERLREEKSRYYNDFRRLWNRTRRSSGCGRR